MTCSDGPQYVSAIYEIQGSGSTCGSVTCDAGMQASFQIALCSALRIQNCTALTTTECIYSASPPYVTYTIDFMPSVVSRLGRGRGLP